MTNESELERKMSLEEEKPESLEEKLRKEADFGDIVELTLKPESEYCAIHQNSKVIISPRNTGIQYQERGILHVAGYYGGLRDTHYEQKGSAFAEHREGDIFVCLNPTLHTQKSGFDYIHCQGEGLVIIPVSAINSYEILSKKRRGLRVVN